MYLLYLFVQNAQDNTTHAVSFCGAKDRKYPDPRGMGYPFDKTWERRMYSTAPVREIIQNLPHAMISDFTIYRSTKLYQGSTGSNPPPHSDITWENTIKYFFTDSEIECMKPHGIDLGNKKSVADHAGEIYLEVKSGDMPQGGPRWNSEKVSKFKEWKDSDCP